MSIFELDFKHFSLLAETETRKLKKESNIDAKESERDQSDKKRS
jgi:hypothetical protein